MNLNAKEIICYLINMTLIKFNYLYDYNKL